MSGQPYTPDTEAVRGQYTREQPPHIGTVLSKSAEFDRWLAKVQAAAWDLGHYNGWRDRRDFPSRMGATNPYRDGAER